MSVVLEAKSGELPIWVASPVLSRNCESRSQSRSDSSQTACLCGVVRLRGEGAVYSLLLRRACSLLLLADMLAWAIFR